MTASNLPTWAEIARDAQTELSASRNALSGARDVLNSDWRDDPPEGAADARRRSLALIEQAKTAIDAAKDVLWSTQQ